METNSEFSQKRPQLASRDQADEDATGTFAEFRANYDGNLGRVVAGIIRNLPKDTTDPDTYPELKHLFGSGQLK